MTKIKLNNKEFEIKFTKDIKEFYKETNDISDDAYEHMLYWINLINDRDKDKDDLIDDI